MQENSVVNSNDIGKSETPDLIGSSKVEGTAVYSSRGDPLGSIYDVMIDKRSGKVAYAVMSFGGFLGLGRNYQALPWEVLEYDARQGGYVLNAETERLVLHAAHDFAERDLNHKIDDYFGVHRNARQ